MVRLDVGGIDSTNSASTFVYSFLFLRIIDYIQRTMKMLQVSFSNQNVLAWIIFVTALALHVLDEATTDFLPFYNQTVAGLREQYGYFPAPTFTFQSWLTGLITVIVIGYLATIKVAQGGRVIRIITIILGILMIANAMGHLVGSLYYEKMPGVRSSPILLAASVWVIIRGIIFNSR